VLSAAIAAPQDGEPPSSNSSFVRDVVIGGLAGFALPFVGGLIGGDGWDDRYVVLAASWCGLFFLMPSSAEGLRSGAAAALVTLGVHLLGAGGLDMPAVMQTAWLWLVLATGQSLRTTADSQRSAWRFASAITVATGVFILGGIWRPVLRADAAVAHGDDASARGDLSHALTDYQIASLADLWSPVAPGRVAEAAFEQWRQLSPRDPGYSSESEAPLSGAMAAVHEAQHRHPNSIEWLQREAEFWLALCERSNELPHARRAEELLERAVAKYPTNTRLLLLWSDAASRAGDHDVGQTAALRALSQDDLNRKSGHVERVLPPSERRRLERRTEVQEP